MMVPIKKIVYRIIWQLRTTMSIVLTQEEIQEEGGELKQKTKKCIKDR